MKITQPFPQDVVLASASPRRAALLDDLGWSFRIVPPDIEEVIGEEENPSTLVLRLAGEKADSVFRLFGGALVIGADTVVVLGETILGKPKDTEDAEKMLSMLSGKEHTVITGVAVRYGEAAVSGFEMTRVFFRQLTESDIKKYVCSGEPMDKAGGYAIQGRGSLLVRSIEGCYFNVVGLPLVRLSRLLEEAGIPLEQQWR
ncbi:MAG TPA: septum formation inhibitor Maf [Synergistetes bacterium]|nr:septum formation inhibitor Maf [Synergistota bacterium]